MYQPISKIGFLAGFTALQAMASESSAVSSEAKEVTKATSAIVESLEQSHALFGAKIDAISRILALVNEYTSVESIAVHPDAIINATKFLRVLPGHLSIPEFAIDPDGAITLDWMESRSQLFSLSIGASNRLAYAWLDGTDKGHGVAHFDGQQVPRRVLEGINAITSNANPSIRAA